MSHDQLLYYYQQELAFMRQMSVAFAAEHPKIAGHLDLASDSMSDPHVTQLIAASSLANARMRHKLEEEFSETSNGLLQTLYADALAPIPSMAIVQFQNDDKGGVGKKNIPADTLLSSQKIRGHSCTFKTRYPTQLLPIVVKAAVLMGDISRAPRIPLRQDCTSVLKLVLTPADEKISFSELNIDALRFFIHAPPAYSQALYRLLFQHTAAIGIAQSPDDKTPILLGNQHLKAVGFGEEEGMLPYNKRNFFGHYLLRDFLAFPEKFLFFDLIALKKSIQAKMLAENGAMEIYFYLKQSNSTLENHVTASFFVLNCAPIVNLFEKKSEPIVWDHTKAEYVVTVDASQSPESSEIYALRHVFSMSEQGQRREFYPFYGLKQRANHSYYHMLRRSVNKIKDCSGRGTDIFLSFSDLSAIESSIGARDLENHIVYADLYCTDGDLPSRLPFGGDNVSLKIEAIIPGCMNTVTLLTPITPGRQPLLNQTGYWRYVSSLSLNHLSLMDDIDALKNLLKLYQFDGDDSHSNMLEGLLAIHSKDGYVKNSHAAHARNLLWNGKEIILTVDETKFSDMSLYLFGSLLSHFFSLYSSINFFTRLTIRNRHSEIFSFEPRVGAQTFVK